MRVTVNSSAILPPQKLTAQARLRDDCFDIDDLEDTGEYGYARFYTGIKRLRSEIRELPPVQSGTSERGMTGT